MQPDLQTALRTARTRRSASTRVHLGSDPGLSGSTAEAAARLSPASSRAASSFGAGLDSWPISGTVESPSGRSVLGRRARGSLWRTEVYALAAGGARSVGTWSEAWPSRLVFANAPAGRELGGSERAYPRRSRARGSSAAKAFETCLRDGRSCWRRRSGPPGTRVPRTRAACRTTCHT